MVHPVELEVIASYNSGAAQITDQDALVHLAIGDEINNSVLGKVILHRVACVDMYGNPAGFVVKSDDKFLFASFDLIVFDEPCYDNEGEEVPADLVC